MTMFDHDGGGGSKFSKNVTTWYMDAPLLENFKLCSPLFKRRFYACNVQVRNATLLLKGGCKFGLNREEEGSLGISHIDILPKM